MLLEFLYNDRFFVSPFVCKGLTSLTVMFQFSCALDTLPKKESNQTPFIANKER